MPRLIYRKKPERFLKKRIPLTEGEVNRLRIRDSLKGIENPRDIELLAKLLLESKVFPLAEKENELFSQRSVGRELNIKGKKYPFLETQDVKQIIRKVNSGEWKREEVLRAILEEDLFKERHKFKMEIVKEIRNKTKP